MSVTIILKIYNANSGVDVNNDNDDENINNENSGDNANDNNGDDSQESMCKVVETIIPQSNFFLLVYIE